MVSPRKNGGGSLSSSTSSRKRNATLETRASDRCDNLGGKDDLLAESGWMVVHHRHLPKWLRINDFLVQGHRPPLNSFTACIKSIFRIHTETGNIWTHLLGFLLFILSASWYLYCCVPDGEWQEKAVFVAFFAGAVLCLGFSFTYHTLICHSPKIYKIFHKLDYCGISLLVMGSFAPFLYYSFYCRPGIMIMYSVCLVVMGTTCIIFSMMDRFAEPRFRAIRAGTFIALGLSGVIPAMHIVAVEGLHRAIEFASLGWLILMAVLYIVGAIIYAARIPERIWPGKFDIWFQSHQIFHIFVVAAAFVHFHGTTLIAQNRLEIQGHCLELDTQ